MLHEHCQAAILFKFQHCNRQIASFILDKSIYIHNFELCFQNDHEIRFNTLRSDVSFQDPGSLYPCH